MSIAMRGARAGRLFGAALLFGALSTGLFASAASADVVFDETISHPGSSSVRKGNGLTGNGLGNGLTGNGLGNGLSDGNGLGNGI